MPMEGISWPREALHAFAYRIKFAYHLSPYNRTLYIDADTYFYENCRELFDLMDYFDICMSIAPRDKRTLHINGKPLRNLAFYNCGVIVFRKNSVNKKLFEEWYKIYADKYKQGELKDYEGDQSSFMIALLNSTVRIQTLPGIYNARISCYVALHGLVKIVHGKLSDFEKVRETINTTSAQRVWIPHEGKCVYSPKLSIYNKLNRRIHHLFGRSEQKPV